VSRAIECAVEVDTTPLDVWSVLTDLDAYPQWHPHIGVASGEIVVGERVMFRMTPPGRRAFTIRPKVVCAEPGRRLHLVGEVPGLFRGEHTFELEQLDSGKRTRLLQGETYRGLIALLIPRTIAANRREFAEANQALKSRVEQRRADL
jgi:hypothetical protein